jgi:hypothetical protein
VSNSRDEDWERELDQLLPRGGATEEKLGIRGSAKASDFTNRDAQDEVTLDTKVARRPVVREPSGSLHLADDRIKRAVGMLRWAEIA